MTTSQNTLRAPIAPPPSGWQLVAWEAVAVVLGATYTYLITYGSVWCWPAAFISSAIFVYLCWRKRIYADAALNLFYVAMAVYGWTTWGNTIEGGYITLPWQTHAWVISGSLAVGGVVAWLLRRYTNAFWPGVDTLIAVFGVVATILMIMAVRENWYYWIVIDAVSILLYASRRMYLTTALFVVYTILAINGAMEWS